MFVSYFPLLQPAVTLLRVTERHGEVKDTKTVEVIHCTACQTHSLNLA